GSGGQRRHRRGSGRASGQGRFVAARVGGDDPPLHLADAVGLRHPEAQGSEHRRGQSAPVRGQGGRCAQGLRSRRRDAARGAGGALRSRRGALSARQVSRGGQGVSARVRGARHWHEGRRLLQHGQRVAQARALQRSARRLQAHARPQARRSTRQVEPRAGAAQAAGAETATKAAAAVAEQGRQAEAGSAAAAAAATTTTAAGAAGSEATAATTTAAGAAAATTAAAGAASAGRAAAEAGAAAATAAARRQGKAGARQAGAGARQEAGAARDRQAGRRGGARCARARRADGAKRSGAATRGRAAAGEGLVMRTLLTIAATVALASTAWADAAGVRFEATVSSENITQDQQVELTVTLEHSGSQPFESYRAPTAPDFDLLHQGSNEQTQFSMVNGHTSVRIIEQHDYIFHPRKRGALKIGPAMARIAGTELKTREITIHVGAPLKNAMSSVGKGQPQPGIALPPTPDNLRGDEDLFVDASTDKTKVYVGQQVTASWHLYTASEILKYRPLAEPKYEDFWSEDLFVPTSHLAWDR